MTKQQYIQQEWEKCLPEGVKWEDVEKYVDKNGWGRWAEYLEGKVQANPNSEGTKFRPKSLQGIEHNFGWKRIEDGLPTEEGKYNVGKFRDEIFFQSKSPYDLTGLKLYAEKDGYTHYQLIKPIMPPLY